MTASIVLNQSSELQIKAYLAQPKHALGLVGPTGVGKGTVATFLASSILGVSADKLEIYPYFQRFMPNNGTISIEQARSIATFMRLKTAGNNSIRRVAVIENAETLTIEAQNALLKTIEEPPVDTVLILTLTTTKSVLPTIISRVQTIKIAAPDNQQLKAYFLMNGFEPVDIERSLRISSNKPGLAAALLQDSSEHPLVESINLSKKVLQADTFERLIMIDEIIKNKQLDNLLTALGFTAQAALEVAAEKKASQNVIKKWTDILKITLESKEGLHQNAQSKLLLTNLFLGL